MSGQDDAPPSPEGGASRVPRSIEAFVIEGAEADRVEVRIDGRLVLEVHIDEDTRRREGSRPRLSVNEVAECDAAGVEFVPVSCAYRARRYVDTA